MEPGPQVAATPPNLILQLRHSWGMLGCRRYQGPAACTTEQSGWSRSATPQYAPLPPRTRLPLTQGTFQICLQMQPKPVTAAAAATAAVANTPLPPPLSVAIASKVGTLPARGRALAASAAAAAGPLAGAAGREEGLECMGYECYTPTFRVLVLLHVLSLCGVVWMMQSTKAQYAVIVAGRKQQQLQQQQQQHPDG
uniref:Uncharacterized protein n=1 Tax=Dunaliella tertiolecta TaxID=3047 RepID=A0A7S3R1L5_DUNTE